jgi:hypothetical protein
MAEGSGCDASLLMATWAFAAGAMHINKKYRNAFITKSCIMKKNNVLGHSLMASGSLIANNQ